MSSYLIFPGGIDASHLKSATTQAGGRIGPVEAGAGNAGQLTLAVTGEATADVDILATIDTAGNVGTATFKLSTDNGATTLGRKVDTTWDGNGATNRTIYAGSSKPGVSRPCPMDTDGDGVIDSVFVAVRLASTSSAVKIYKTTDLTGAGSWTEVCADATGSVDLDQYDGPSLVVRGSQLFLFYRDGATLLCSRSVDYGVTWGAGATVTTDGSSYGCDCIVLASGKLLVAYLDGVSTYSHAFCRSSNDGVTWSAAKQITAAGSVNYTGVSLVQESSGKTIAFVQRYTATAAVQARQTTAADPAAGTWAAWSETMFAASAAELNSAAIAPDGTIYVITDISGSIQYSTLKGSGTMAAVADAVNDAATNADAQCAFVGGALWMPYVDTTNNDILFVETKYWTTYDASTAPASWTGTSPQFAASGVWITWPGANGGSGDTYAAPTEYDYGAERMVLLRPSRPTRSTADEADWSAVFNLGDYLLLPVDTVCVYANVEHCHFQMNATDSWTSPSVNTTISFVRETIASAGVTIATGKVMRAAGTWNPHELAGLHARFATSGGVFLIRDNDASAIYINANLAGESGDLQILSPRAWATQTKATYRYIRVLIENQKTYSGYYQVPALAFGVRHAAASRLTSKTSWEVPTSDARLLSGGVVRNTHGAARRSWDLTLVKPTVAEYAEIESGIANLGGSPLAFIPDTTKAYDWALVYPSQLTMWDATRTRISVEEAV